MPRSSLKSARFNAHAMRGVDTGKSAVIDADRCGLMWFNVVQVATGDVVVHPFGYEVGRSVLMQPFYHAMVCLV